MTEFCKVLEYKKDLLITQIESDYQQLQLYDAQILRIKD